MASTITWTLDVKGEGSGGAVSYKVDKHVNQVETMSLSDPEEKEIPASKSKYFGIHDGQANDLKFLLVDPQLKSVSELSMKERDEEWKLIKYAFVGATAKAPDKDGPWKNLRGPQMFVNGAAGWLECEGQRLWVQNGSKFPLVVSVLVGKVEGDPDAKSDKSSSATEQRYQHQP